MAGRGEAEEFRDELPPAVSDRIDLLGQVSEDEKAQMLRSVDIYCAPNTGQESFGIILLEALAAGTPIVASDLDAFKQVLRGGAVGSLFTVGDPVALADALGALLDDPRRAPNSRRPGPGGRPFDWAVIAGQVMRVYELAIGGPGERVGRLR